jgi:hypothetical protein
MSVADTLSDAVLRIDEYVELGYFEGDDDTLDKVKRLRDHMDAVRAFLDLNSVNLVVKS